MSHYLRSDLLKFNPRTLENVRREYNLEKPGVMDQAINILHDWIKKQEHLVKKDFHRGYLERVIISTKGSIEKAKTRVDKICTMRTVVPELFEKCHVQNDFPKLHESYINLHMPIPTEDNNRIYIAKVTAKKITPDIFLQAYQHSVILSEYMKLHDYCHGYHVIADLQDVNIMELISNMNVIDFRNVITLYIEGYGFGVKGIYIISTSKMIDAFVNILKQILSDKIGKRIKVLKSGESLRKYLPIRLLPEDYGGSQKSLLTLYGNKKVILIYVVHGILQGEWSKELSSEKHVAYVEEMKQACTYEALRRKDKIHDDYLGMPGSFKTLNID